MLKKNKKNGRRTRMVMTLALVGMLFMSGSAMAYTNSVSNKTMAKGGKKVQLGTGTTKYGKDSARLWVQKSSHQVCGDYPLYFRLRKDASKTVVYVSALSKVTKLNSPVTMKVTKKSALNNGLYYVYGQTDSSSHCDTTISCMWEF